LWVAAVAALVMISSLLLGVFFRYVVRASLTWSGEVALLAFTWTVFVMASVGVREGFHVRIAAIEGWLGSRARRWLHTVLLLTIGGFCLMLVVLGWQFVEFTAGLRSPAIGYPLWLRNAVVPAMGALGFVHVLARLFNSGSVDALTISSQS
jgi:TRAP-type C4-dicarboxylate transport system permease small subunit